MNFGHVNVNTKIKDLQKEKSDILIIDNINPESSTFFMFLLDVAEKDKRVIQNLKNDLKVTIQALGWRSGNRYLPLQEDISSVAYWYSDNLDDEYPTFPSADELEII